MFKVSMHGGLNPLPFIGEGCHAQETTEAKTEVLGLTSGACRTLKGVHIIFWIHKASNWGP
jgi:hypothetical protein